MGLFRRTPPVNQGSAGSALMEAKQRPISVESLVSDYEIIESGDGYALVTSPLQLEERPRQLATVEPYHLTGGEIGYTGPSNWTGFMREEYNTALREVQGMQKYDQMRRSDASVRSSLRLMKTPILAARWYVQPLSYSTRDKMIAKFIHNCLFHYMTISWPQVVFESLLMLDFGHYMFEKVYALREIDGEQRLVYQKLAPRHPMDIEQWLWDDRGGPRGIRMYSPSKENPYVDIPIEKLAIFSFDREGGDLRGISALRSAYKHWYFKENLYKIDAIQKERHGIGIPIIKLPPGFSEPDKAIAHELGRNLRTNEKAHVVLPPMWEILFAKLEGQPVNALESAQHHSEMIYQNVLGEFMYGTQGATNEAKLAIFNKSVAYVAEIIRDVFNKYCIPDLVLANFDITPDEIPEVRVRRIGDTQDWRTLSFAVRNLVGAGALQVDDPLETFLRDEMDLPPLDESTIREVATPQAPGARVGPPRQGPPSANQQGRNAGNDRSGTSGGNR
jgi:hypothetical protein